MTSADTTRAPRTAEQDAETASAVFSAWQSGNQQGALDLLLPPAEEGARWAVALTAWLRMQQGPPGFLEALPWAERAAELGMPWPAHQLFNNLVGHAVGNPPFAEALERLSHLDLFPFGAGMDPVGQAWGLLSQGHHRIAVQVMGTYSRLPATSPQLEALTAQARDQAGELGALVARARDSVEQVAAAATAGTAEIVSHRDEVVTNAEQAKLLISSTESAAVNALYDEEAARHETASNAAWRYGIGVLGLAALVAVLPLLLHYLGRGPEYAATALVGVHVGSTAALGTFAGVLLTRARNHDRARQRARDLSTAMGTMISYSNRIQGQAEKQQFMLTMGQLVLQAHLRGDASPAEDHAGGLASLVTALRPGAAPTQSG